MPHVVRPAASALALGLVSKMDLLQEALTRVLVGARVQPAAVPVVAFVAGVMRSLRSEHRRRWLRAQRERAAAPGRELEVRDEAPLPERVLSARQELQRVHALFADDPLVLAIIDALGEGLDAEQIRERLKLTPTTYDSARRRMRRLLLREFGVLFPAKHGEIFSAEDVAGYLRRRLTPPGNED
jgi:RNA polymerase sigma-70 factor (ECF subfamily)